MFTPEDLAQFKSKEISIEKVEDQLQSFRDGFPFFKLKPDRKSDV